MQYILSDLIGIEKSQELLDSLCDAVGIAAAIIDLEGNVLVGSRWQRICTDFHRVNEKTAQKCTESDTQLANKLRLGEQFSLYCCKNGLTDAASPILIEGQHVANAFVGQFLLEPPDIAFFRHQAARYGFEERSYLDSLSTVPIVEKKRLPIILNFLRTVAESVATTAFDRLRQLEAGKALRESEEKYRTLIETTSEGFWLVDGDGKTLEVNQSLCDMLGYRRQEIIGRSPLDLVDDENGKIFKTHMDKIQETPHRTYEITLKPKTGEAVYTHFSATTIFDESGAARGAFALITDIRERKLAAQRIEHLNAVLRSIRNINRLITTEKDPDRLIQGACNNLVETRGYHNAWVALLDESGGLLRTAEAGIGETFSSLPELLNRGELTDCARRTLTQGDIVVTQDPFSTCTDCPLAQSYGGRGAMSARLEHEGRLYGLLSVSVSTDFAVDEEERSLFEEVSRDIAFALHGIQMEEELRQDQEAMRESAERLTSISSSARDAIVMMDGEGNICHWNEAAKKMFGYSDQEALGKELHLLLAPRRHHQAYRMGLGHFEKTGQGAAVGKTLELTALRKDGTEFPVELSLSAAKLGDKWHATGVLRDISERKQAEEEKTRLEAQLQHAHKMEAIGTLAGGIAHEFNNILGIVLGNAELAMDEVPEWYAARNNLGEIRKACLRAKDVVKQILAFSRQEEQERKSVRLEPIIKEAAKLLRSTIATTIEIHHHVSAKSDVVLADSTQIHQVLINLCANAAQAMSKEGGVLDVSLDDFELDDETAGQHPDLEPGSYVRLTVSDTGHGIAPEFMGRIFDPYFTTKEVGKGTGMGLAVVHGIVKTHGGAVTVKSTLGKGTAFHVLLPTVTADVESEPHPPEVVPTGTERVLIVDDEQPIVNLLEQLLERLGYTVVKRMSSLEALEVFRAAAERFDLVITDMTMPHMAGDRLAKELMKIRPDIPIILSTGHSERIDEAKAKAMGIRALIMKPFLKRDIAETIRRVLEHR
ncbi:MAG: PAS domain S-box protein [Thermodesulfobacteriota bacterium]|nr:PAS domain S-box protein [Thermodesulfobacteriota bacterium]